MAGELPEALQPLPVFKVLYRNSNRIQERGGRKEEVLHAVEASKDARKELDGAKLREAVRLKDMNGAESIFATLAQGPVENTFNELLWAVQDHTEVHRVVLPYRAWDLMGLIGKEQAHTLLRQSVRYCVKAESWPQYARSSEPRELLPKLLEQHGLVDRSAGTRKAE